MHTKIEMSDKMYKKGIEGILNWTFLTKYEIQTEKEYMEKENWNWHVWLNEIMKNMKNKVKKIWHVDQFVG